MPTEQNQLEQFQGYAKHIGADEFIMKWVNTTLRNYLEKERTIIEEVEHILDYLVISKKKILKMSYDQAKSNAEKWMKTQIKKGNNIVESPEDTKILLDFKDGFKIVQLVGENAYKREGFLMRHCAASYFGKDVEVYSLRDKNNMPHATLEKDRQVKGKGNGSIHPKYVDYVVRFLKEIGMSVGDSEMKHLGYINISKWKKELSKETLAKCYGEYIQDSEQLVGKDGEEFASLDLWNVKDLVKVNIEGNISLQSNLAVFIAAALKWLSTKTKKGKVRKDNSNGARIGSSGYGARIGSSGNGAQIGSSGNGAQIELNGQDTVGVSAGINCIIKGKIRNWITLSEWKAIDNKWKPICVKSAQIDGKVLKEDIWYKLEGGEFIEVK